MTKNYKNCDTVSKITYITKKSTELSEIELQKCSDLFSNHYGIWAEGAPNRKGGNRVKMSVKYYKDNLCSQNDHYIAMAFKGDELVGHAFYLRKIILNKGFVTWILQLVVHADYRKKGIGRKLMQSIWAFSNDLAWGLATANPLTVKALEEATMREVNPTFINNHIDLINEIIKDISFAGELQIDAEKSFINSGFYIDHSEIPLKKLRYGKKWMLGEYLPEGMEWLAFTFSDQPILVENKELLENMIQFSEYQLKEAYSRMQFTNQKWASNTKHEVSVLIDRLHIKSDQIIGDFGCGIGRHSLEFANQGFKVFGIDFVKSNIDFARSSARKLTLRTVKFLYGDCRTKKLPMAVNVALCLYDVVGSFPNEADNIYILRNIYENLVPDGYLVLSVMNMELTKSIAINFDSVYDNPKILVSVKHSQTCSFKEYQSSFCPAIHQER